MNNRITDPEEVRVDETGLPVTRRTFVKSAALVGGGVALAGGVQELVNAPTAKLEAGAHAHTLSDPRNIIYTSCLQCNTGCAIKVKLTDGVVAKIDGSPFSPMTFWPHLDYATSPLETGGIDGWICPKGQAGIQAAYDPYRLRRVLKRVGPRGGGEWESIPFAQAIDEIVNGAGFSDGSTHPGLKEIRKVTDPDLSKEIADAIGEITGEKDKDKKKELVAKFKETFAANLDAMIDPEHPDLGFKNNQFCFIWGRLKDGRGDVIKRFTGDSFGSVNAHGHTTVCQGSLYFIGKAMSEQFKEGKWSDGKKFYWQGDFTHSEFVILVGSNVFEGGYGPPYRVEKMTEGLASGRLKYVVIDPRLGKTGSKAWKWLPAKPGTEAATALAMIQAIIRDERYNAGYLANVNKSAAMAAGEPNFCNAAWLIKLDEDGKPGKMLRGSDLGLEPEERDKEDGSGTWEFDPFVTLVDGSPVTFDPNDEENPVVGDLLVDGVVGGHRVMSSLAVLAASANEHSMEEWADIADVDVADLEEIAREFTSHGRRAVADIHRGVSQHTNGYYNAQAWFDLNLLIGNIDYAGGLAEGKTYDQGGGKEGQPYPISSMLDHKLAKAGETLIRTGKYESSTIFDGYPAKRPWYPLATDVYQEIVPSIGDMYPYPIKALFMYMGSPVYSLPAGHINAEILKDTSKLPLFVSCDIVVGETSAYADYIIPDLSYLERWEFQKSHFSVIAKNAPVRQPVIAPMTETATVFGIEQPISLESFLLAIAEKMELPGFGPNGFGEGSPFMRPEDLYIKQVANIAYGEKPDLEDAVDEASDEELELFLAARRHLPSSMFDPAAWRAAVDDDSLWRRVVTVLNRGGRFQSHKSVVDGSMLKNKYGLFVSMYCEKTYDTKDSMTGEHFSGVARYFDPGVDSVGTPVSAQDAAEGYDLTLITYRTMLQTKSRTSGNYWLTAVEPTNHVIVARADATRLGLADGDRVRVVSKTNPGGVFEVSDGNVVDMVGELEVIEGLRPGVIGFNLGFGHWAYGSTDVVVDGETILGDPRRGRGIHANPVMRTDGQLPNTCLSDLVGGSAVFYDTQVKLIQA